jgi:glyoxylase-like metal-dependent hydrolase (beta-lactamase superfamily II)
MHRLEWRLLEVGHCLQLECGAIRGGRWRVCEFPALVGVLRHPERGWVLFDTGYSQRFLEATAKLPAALYRCVTPVRFDPRKALALQLDALGVDKADIGAIVLSHFHADHVAGVLDFPGVPVFCSRAGWQSLRSKGSLAALRTGLLPELAPRELNDRTRFLEDLPPAALEFGSQMFFAVDLFADGSVVAVSLPGHSEGHFGVRFTAPDDRQVMLVGDAAWSTKALREHRLPPVWTTGWLGNTRIYRETFARLHTLTASRPDLQIVPSHCPEWRP